jgi:DNA mismatch repair ATPase MutS
MSGKSTFLKAIGVAVVLAWAGAPVTAKRFRVSKVSLAASTTVGDSLHDRKSRFLTEAGRIGKILELARAQQTVLYLFDEMLSGTNSHDRRIGAEAILSALVEAGAMGAITTHDLAITEIVQQIGERACNVHFADSIAEGLLHFDYRLRRGVVQTSNALEMLRSCGINL